MTVLRSNVAVKADEVLETQTPDQVGGCHRPDKAGEERAAGFMLAAYRRQREKFIMWDEV